MFTMNPAIKHDKIMNSFINQPVVNWARHTLLQAVEVELKGKSLAYKIFYVFSFAVLALIFLGIPLLFYISAISSFINDGWNNKVSSGLISGTVFLGMFGTIVFIIFLITKFTRRNFAKFISANGVETRKGQKFYWAKLHYLDYKKVNTQIPGNLIASTVRAAMFSGVEKVTVVMIFENGKAVVPPLIENQPQILALLGSIPVQRRDDGKIICEPKNFS